jgi:carboxypeptidase PM20D1
MKRLLLGLAATLGLLATVVVVRTARVAPAAKAPPAGDLVAVDAAAAAARLAGAVRIPTVTHSDRARIDWAPFARLHAYLESAFPRLHATLAREVVAPHSLLYTWAGTDPAAAPILLLAHQDVVPIEPGTEGAWSQPPFAGVIADGFVWGRGALDDKGSLMAQLEAVEALLAAGFRPRRTIHFAFGHDEEIGGEGARAVAALLRDRGVRAEFVLDEGGSITLGMFPGVDPPVAAIMNAEKGYVSVRLTARDAGGHSSMPPPVTAVGRLAAAVARLEQRPLPPRLGPPVTDVLDRLAPALPLTGRLAIANRWLFGALIERALARSPVTNALVRTTTAPTIFQAGIKDNILPVEARAVVNFRVRPGETVAEVLAQVRAAVADPAVELAIDDFSSEPSPVSGTDTPAFAALERTVNEVFPEALVAPGLVVGATDSRHYGAVRAAGYNFVPLPLDALDLKRIHGINERVAVKDYARAVQFYARLLRNTAGP